MNIGLGIGTRYPKFNQLSLALKAISAIRRNNGTLIGIPDNFAGTYTDSTGTTPVTAVGDLVGLLTDRLGVLGPELLPALSDAVWAKTNAAWSTAGGKAVATSCPDGQSYYITGKSAANKSYRYTLTLDSVATGGVYISIGGSISSAVFSAPGTYTGVLRTTTSNGNINLVAAGTTTLSVAAFSTFELLGQHATQPTTASKPVVTRVPKRLGPNLVVNGTFDSGATGWSANSGGAISVSGGELTVTNSIASSGRGYQMVPTSVGKPYLITSFARAGTASAIVGWGALAGSSAGGSVLTASAQTLQLAFVATAASTSVTLQTNTATAGHAASFDNIEVREVLEWTNAIGFDGSNDFLQTGITTGNEGWICAGVTPANTTTVMSVANAGEGTATVPGVWLFSSGAGNWTASAADGSLRTQQTSPVLGTNAQVVSMGWTASTLTVGVNNTEVAAPKIGAGSWSSGANVMRFGLYQGSSIPFNGPMTAIIYTPVLPNAADRALIRRWIGSLQGQTL